MLRRNYYYFQHSNTFRYNFFVWSVHVIMYTVNSLYLFFEISTNRVVPLVLSFLILSRIKTKERGVYILQVCCMQ